MSKTTNVPIPFTGGLDEGTEPLLITPPNVSASLNLVGRKKGGVQKIAGASSLGAVGGGIAGVIASRENGDLVVLGPQGAHTYGPTTAGWSDAPTSHPVPIRSRFHRAMAVRGLVSVVQVAYSGGYVAVAAQVSETNSASGLDTPFLRCVVLDQDDNVVWGPHDIDTMRYYPRVEPLDFGDGVYGFVFVAYGAANGNTSPGPLLAFQVRSDTWATPSTITLTSDCILTSGTTNSEQIVLDTCPGTSDYAFLAFKRSTAADLAVVKLDGVTAHTPTTVHGSAGNGNFAVWYDADTNTVLVYSEDTTSIYADSDALLGPSAYASAGSWTKPVFYNDGNGNILLNGMRVTLTGSNPATPSFTGSASFAAGGLTARPQACNLGFPTLFFELYKGDGRVVADGGIRRIASASVDSNPPRETTCYDAQITSSVHGNKYVATPLMGSIIGPAMANGFHDPYGGTGHNRGVVLQTALAGTKILVPIAADDPGGHGYFQARKHNASTDTDFLDREQGGPYNGDQTVGWVELSESATDIEASFLQYQNSLLAAVGPLVVWDGRSWQDVTVQPPEWDLTPYDTSLTTNETLSDWSELHVSPSNGYAHINYWAMKLVLVYTDSNGIEYRSAPSLPFVQQGIPDTAGHATTTADPCPAIRLRLNHSHQRIIDDGGSFDVEVYVTERDDGGTLTGTAVGAATLEDALGSSYYLAQRTPLQYTTAYYVPDFMRAAYKGSFARGGQSIPLYTDSGELPPVRPPAAARIAEAGNYLFLIPSEMPYQIWASKPLEVGRGPEFNPSLIINVPAGSGGIESIAPMADSLVLLGRRGIYEMYVGQGPDATGAGSFAAPRLLHAGDGCVNSRGTVSTPSGVVYIARSGPKLIGSDGSFHDIGDAVYDSCDPDTIIGATYHDTYDEVWLFQSGGTHLIYSMRNGTWTTTDLPSVSATYFDGAFYRLLSTGAVHKEDSSRAQDSSSNILGSLSTGWISFQDVEGFKRAHRIGILLRMISGTYGEIQVKLAYNYDDTVVDTFTWTYSEIAALDVPGHLEVRPSRQKFDAIKITVAEAAETVGQSNLSNQIWTLAGIEIEIMAKQGIMKLEQGAKK